MKRSGLIRKTPLRPWRRPKSEHVPECEAVHVLKRDNGCVARIVDGSCITLPEPVDECHGRITLEHVRDAAAMGGKRAPSDRRHLVALCWHHHLDGWATSHKALLRAYLLAVEGEGEI